MKSEKVKPGVCPRSRECAGKSLVRAGGDKMAPGVFHHARQGVAVTRFALLSAFALLSDGILAADDKAKEPAGTYAVTAIHKGGKDVLGDAKGATVKFADGTMTVSIADRTYAAKVKFDAAKSPATLDISPSDGKEQGKTFLGIYAVDGEELTVAFVEEGARPKDFKGDGDATVMKLKKAK